MANPLDSTNRALQDVNLDVSGGVQQNTAERVGEAQKDSSTGRTTMSYNVKMTMDNGTQRSFKITVGFSREQLAAHLSGQGEGSGKLEDTIDKIVNGMKAEDIMKAAGQRISARLDDLDNATVAKLQGGGQTRQLSQLIESSDESERTMANSISKVINAFSKSEVGKLFSSNVNPQTSSSGTNSPPQGTGTRNQDVDQVAALESRLGVGPAPADLTELNALMDQLTNDPRGENSNGGTDRTDSGGSVGVATLQPQGQGEAHVGASIPPNTGESDRLSSSKRAFEPKSSPLGQHRNRASSESSISPEKGTTKEKLQSALAKEGNRERRLERPSADQIQSAVGKQTKSDHRRTRLSADQIKSGLAQQTPPPSSDKRESEGASEKKGASGQIQQADTDVIGVDVTELNDASRESGNPTVHSVRTSLNLEFEVVEEQTTPQTTPPRRLRIGEMKTSRDKEQQAKALQMTVKIDTLKKLDAKLTSETSKSGLETKTGIKSEEYQAAVSAILELEDAGETEVTYDVLIPGQTLSDGDIPKTKPRTVGTTPLIMKFLKKEEGKKAIIQNGGLYEKIKENSLEKVKKYSPALAKSLEKMPQSKKKDKLNFLTELLKARSVATRYDNVMHQLDRSDENIAAPNTDKVNFNYQAEGYSGLKPEEKQQKIEDLDSQIASLQDEMSKSSDTDNFMSKIGDLLLKKELIKNDGDFSRTDVSLQTKLAKAKKAGNNNEVANLEAASKEIYNEKNKLFQPYRQTLRVIGEIAQTEMEYFDGLTNFSNSEYYDKLLKNKLITPKEHDLLKSQLNECKVEAARSMCAYAGIQYIESADPAINISNANVAFKKLNPEEKLKNTLDAFKPGRMKHSIKPMAGMALKQKQTMEILSKAESNPKGEALKKAFMDNKDLSAGRDPNSFVMKPTQRVAKFPLLLRELEKTAPPSAQAGISTNFKYMVDQMVTINGLNAK